MFRKRPKHPGEDALAARVRKLAEEAAPDHGHEHADGKVAGHDVRFAKTDREPTFGDGLVETRAGLRQVVAVKNVSHDGARIESAHALPLADEVLLSAPGLGLKCWAHVVWREERAAGLKFESKQPRRAVGP
jgi:hypothetical protein